MKKTTLLMGSIFIILIIFLIYSTTHFYTVNNTENIVITGVARVDFENAQIDSNLVWSPNSPNTVAAIREGYSKSDIVYGYDLNNGQKKELLRLKDHNFDKGNSIQFFWSRDGQRIVNGKGSIVYLNTQSSKDNIKLSESFFWFNVFDISPDGKYLAVDTGEILFIEVDTETRFNLPINPTLFPSSIHPLAWSTDGNWVAVRVSDSESLSEQKIETSSTPNIFPTINPTPFIYTQKETLEALYLLHADGKKVQEISRSINGVIEYVTFSPDSKKIIWVIRDYDGNQFIYIANIDGSGAHEIFSNKGLPSIYKITRNILWSPNGNNLVVLGKTNSIQVFWIFTLGIGDPIVIVP